MICGSCRHDNEPNAKFCSECGAPLAARCAACGSDQPPGAKFCNQCGGAMTETVEVPPAATPPASAVRKSVTALFGDLVGSTAFGERVDPEAARAALAPYFQILRTTIEDHAGTVVKFTGDGVMAVFGIPEVAEDDALRAVAAGLELQRRFRAFAESVRDRHGVELGLRVGINTGELVIGEGDADLVGDVLNTAARLEAACNPGRVMVGEDTWRLTRSSVTYEVLGEVRVKGKADALATFQVVDSGLATVEESIPFVGRAGELELVRGVVDDAVASSACRLVTVIGAPGVGKTRLASELRSGVRARSFDLRFERRGSTTFTPIVELLRELTGSGTADDIRRLVDRHPEADQLAGVLASFLGFGEARSTEESFWGVRRLLEHLAADEPLVVVVDDIQWAEPLFWDLLDHLAEWTSAPVVLLALARPELRDLRPELAQAGRRVAASVSLEGLDAATTRELAARLLDTDELPTDLLDRLPASTEGNPLFVRELVQMLVDDGVLARSGDRWHLTIDVDAIEVPPTVLSLLASRVERLPDDERQVVELASVIGTEFDRGTLGSIAGPTIASRLGALIDRLRRKDLVEPSGAWAGDHPVYRFHHVLVRDAAYRRLLKSHRADLHERVGRYLEGVVVDGDEGDVVVAHHYEQVYRYRSELGTVDDATRALGGEAVHRLRSAAEQALAREDLASSGSYTMRALALVDDDRRRDDLLVLGCEALLQAGDVARGAPLVVELLGRSLDARLTAWADCFQAQFWSMTDPDRLDEAADLADDAAGRLDALDDAAGVAKARFVRATVLARLGRIGDCETELDLALAAARKAGDRRRTVAVLGGAPRAALWGPSPVARAGGRCLDVLRLLRITTSSPAVEATSIRCQGMLEAMRGRFDSARDKFETSRSTARDLGLRQGLYETELFAGLVELLAGDPITAESHLVLARDGLGALGIGADAGQASALLARSLLQQGRVDEADPLATAAYDSAGQNLQTAIGSRAALAEIRAAQGRHDEAERLASEAIEIADRTDITFDRALAFQAAARVAAAAGDAEEASRRTDAARRLLDEKGVVVDSTSEVAAGDRPDVVAPTGEASPTGLDNECSGIVRELMQAFDRDDRAAAIELLAPQFEYGWHERMRPMEADGDRVMFVDALFRLTDLFHDDLTVETVAIRDDELCLARLVDVASTAATFAVALASQGRLVRLDWYGADQLGEAQDELDRRWVESGGAADQARNATRLRAAFVDRNLADIRACVTDDMVSVDRRRGGVLDRTADEWAASMEPFFEALPIWRRYAAHSIGCGVYLLGIDHPDGASWDLWVVQTLAGDRVSYIELFDIDDLDAALARFAELDGRRSAGEDHPAPTSASDVLDDEPATVPRHDAVIDVVNTSSRLVDAVVESANAGDLGRVRSLLHPDHRMIHRFRLGDPRGRLDRDQTIDNMAAMHAQGLRLSTRTLAIRGDDLSLTHTVLDGDVGVSERYVVNRSVDGLCVEGISFDQDQLHDALDELDRRWIERGGPASLVEILVAIRRAWAQQDLSALRDLLADDFAAVDHRPLGLGTRTADQWLESNRTLIEGDGTSLLCSTEYVRHTESVAVVRTRFGSASDDSLFEALFVVRIRHGRLERSEMFGADDLEAAVGRFGELVSEAPTGRSSTFSNRSWETSRAMIAAHADGDRAAYAIHLRDDVIFTAHDPIMGLAGAHGELDRTTLLDVLFHDDLAGAGHGSAAELVAVRSDRFCLNLSVATSADGDVTERLYLVEIDDNRRCRRVDSFRHDQLIEAYDELDRRFLQTLPIDDHETMWKIRTGWYATDEDGIAPILHPRFRFRDHRKLTWPDADRDTMLEYAATLPTDSCATVPEIFGVTDHAFAVRRVQFMGNGTSRTDSIVVGRVEDGLAVSMDWYEVDDLERALEQYHELSAVGDDPWAVVERAWQAFVDGDVDRHRECFAPDFVGSSRERLSFQERTLGRAEWTDQTFALRDAGELTEPSLERLAERAGRLLLARKVGDLDGARVEFLMIHHVERGRIVGTVVFDGAQFDEALDELDGQWVELGGSAEAAHRMRMVARTLSTGPQSAFAALFAPGFEVVDHRQLGLGSRDREEFLASTEALIGTIVAWTAEVLEATVAATLTRVEMRSQHQAAVWSLLLITTYEGALVSRWEQFSVDDVTAARSRFEELTADRVSATTTTSLWNRATSITELLTTAGADGDRSRFSDLLTDDFASVTHEQLRISHDQLPDRDTFVRQIFDVFDLATDVEIDSTVVAIRGDDLCLMHIDTRLDAGHLDRYVVMQTVGDRIGATEWFDIDDLDAALDVLDRRWAGTGGPERVLEHTVALRRAIHDGDIEAAGAVLSPDFRATDHRRLGLPPLDRDAYLAAPKGGSGTRLLVVDVARHTDDATLERIEVRLEDGWSTMEMWAVISLDAHGIATIDNYDIDDAVSAHARFDELTSGTPADPSPTFSNRAVVVLREAIAAHDAADRPRCTSLLADAMVFVARDPIMQFASPGGELGREAWLDMVFHEDLAGAGHVSTSELIAIRGDLFCLLLVRNITANGEVSDRLYLGEIDGTDRIVRIDSFRVEQRDTALDELERRYAATVDAGIDHFLPRFRADMRSMEVERIRPWLDPEFRFRDHRAVAWPELDGEGWVEHVMGSIPPGMSMVIHRILLTTSDGSVEHGSITDADGSATIPSILIVLFRDEQLIRVEMFDPHDDDAALTRFRELTSDAGVTATSTVPPLVNASTELVESLHHAIAQRDEARRRTLLHPDAVHESRRSTTHGVDAGLTDADLDHLVRTEGLDDRIRIETETLAVRGDDLSLARCVVHFGDDEITYLSLSELRDGLRSRSVTFDETDVLGAVDELEARWLARGGPPDVVAASHAARHAFAVPGFDLDLLPWAEDFVTIDHRLVGLGRRDREEFIASSDLLTPSDVFAPQIFAWDGDLAFWEIEIVRREEEFVWQALHVVRLRGTEYVDLHVFDLDQYAEARALYEQLVVDQRNASDGDMTPLTNRATGLLERLHRAWADGFVDEDEFYEPDVVFAGRRASAPAIDGGRQALTGIVDYWSEIGVGSVDVEMLAVRGEHLALSRQTVTTADGDVFEVIGLGRVGKNGRFDRVTMWDPAQLAEAQLELERWHLEEQG